MKNMIPTVIIWNILDKILNAENEIMQYSNKEQRLISELSEVKEKFHFLLEEKRDLEIEFISLKKNFIQTNKKVDEEK